MSLMTKIMMNRTLMNETLLKTMKTRKSFVKNMNITPGQPLDLWLNYQHTFSKTTCYLPVLGKQFYKMNLKIKKFSLLPQIWIKKCGVKCHDLQKNMIKISDAFYTEPLQP